MQEEMNSKAMRMQYWSELSLEEKVERLRQEIRALEAREDSVVQVLEDTKRHIHNQDGLPVIQNTLGGSALGYRLGQGSGGIPPNDDVYI